MIAYWCGMTWECSQQEISVIESLTTSFAINTEVNADKEGNAPTEQVAMADIEIGFATTYRIETGTPDINGKIEAWKSMIGRAGPLIIGSVVFAAGNMQLQSVNVSNISMRANGLMTCATVSFKFKEFKGISSIGSKGKSTSTENTSNNTAINVQPNKKTKEQKKADIVRRDIIDAEFRR